MPIFQKVNNSTASTVPEYATATKLPFLLTYHVGWRKKCIFLFLRPGFFSKMAHLGVILYNESIADRSFWLVKIA